MNVFFSFSLEANCEFGARSKQADLRPLKQAVCLAGSIFVRTGLLEKRASRRTIRRKLKLCAKSPKTTAATISLPFPSAQTQSSDSSRAESNRAQSIRVKSNRVALARRTHAHTNLARPNEKSGAQKRASKLLLAKSEKNLPLASVCECVFAPAAIPKAMEVCVRRTPAHTIPMANSRALMQRISHKQLNSHWIGAASGEAMGSFKAKWPQTDCTHSLARLRLARTKF